MDTIYFLNTVLLSCFSAENLFCIISYTHNIFTYTYDGWCEELPTIFQIRRGIVANHFLYLVVVIISTLQKDMDISYQPLKHVMKHIYIYKQFVYFFFFLQSIYVIYSPCYMVFKLQFKG